MITLNHMVKTYIQAKMEAMDAQRALEAVERLQAKLKDRGEAPTEEKLSLLKTVLQSPLFHQILNIQQTKSQLPQVNTSIPKSVSLNAGLSTSMSLGLRGLSHSDSYTWAQNNSSREFVSPGPDTDEEDGEGGGCSPRTEPVVPQQKFGGSLCTLNTHAENRSTAAKVQSMTQLCTPPRISRTLSMGRNLSDIANDKRHVEMIELENDGKGLGFGIVGGRTSGIMVKTILPRGPAGLDKRLRSGDHILRIGDTDLAGMDNEEVAHVLRGAGPRVKLLIARDVAVSTGNDLSLSAPLLPQLAQQQQRMTRMGNQLCDAGEGSEYSIQFSKNSVGLGFTVGSSPGQRQSGVHVRSIVKGSAVDQDNQIHIGDKILAVDGVSLQGCSEQRALEILRETGQIVRLRLARRASGAGEHLKSSTSSLETQGVINRGEPGRQMSLREMSRRASMLSRGQRPDARTGVKLTDAEEEELRNRWQGALGLRYQVVVCQLERFSESRGLGISLEARAGHHYLCSILPEGPVGQSGKIRAGDQILEVNGIPLIGESHREVISILRELPPRVVLVCCRILAPQPRHGDEDEDEDEELQSQYDQPCCLLPGCNNVDCGNRGVKPVSPPLAMWERDSQIIELEKGEEGLGFSILDYQDPEDASKTVLVIRSLVPGGVADTDGRLLPGDRLMSVNNVDLVSSTLQHAVNILKSSDCGTVRIGVSKPLPIECCVLESIPESLRSSRDEIRSSRDENDTQYSAGMLASPSLRQAHADSYSSQPRNRLHCYKDEKSLHQRLGGNMQDSDKHLAPAPFGSHFERTITVVRDNRNLGMTVSAVKDGSGMLIRSVVQGGCVSQDGRLGVGDVILAVNGEPTTNLSNARARAMLRRHSVRGPSMSVTLVPSSLVEEHRASLSLKPLSSVEGPPHSPPAPSTPPPSGHRTPSPGTADSDPAAGPVSPTRRLGSPPRPSRPVGPVTNTGAPGSGSVSSKGPPRPPPPDHSLIPKPMPLVVQPPEEEPGLSVDGGRGEEEKGEQETREEGGGEEETLQHPNNLSWGQPRRVQLGRSPGRSLGISITG
uniref:PATJ crumbs cell polarity complex component n=1 Tax=Esox lucius TaxID=8010 RepID=A0AAY5L9B8_ESOLU